jgi:hypothetical protein
MRIGITGHQRLKDPTRWNWVKRELDHVLSSTTSPLIGVTSLAIGADQVFAEAVLARGGSLEVIVPFADYEFKFSEGHDREEYLRLLASASDQSVLEPHGSNEEAYLAAGQCVVDRSELLLAVWDGAPAAGLGGTGDAVNYALQQGKKLIHLNPVTLEINEL